MSDTECFPWVKSDGKSLGRYQDLKEEREKGTVLRMEKDAQREG